MKPNGYKEVTDCYCIVGDHRVTATGAYGFRRFPKCPKHKNAMQILSVHQVKDETESHDCSLA